MKNTFIVLLVILSICLVGCENKSENSSNNDISITEGTELHNEAQNITNESDEKIDETLILIFNSKFEQFAGDDVYAPNANMMYSLKDYFLNSDDPVDADLKKYAENIVIEGLTKDEISKYKKYNISTEYGADGFINKIIIAEK